MLKINKENLDILNKIIEQGCCPFLDQDKYSEECDPECICRMFSNSDMTCFEIAKEIKSILKI